MANSAVFNFRRNAGSDWLSLTEAGREFQARDAAAGNARSPMVARVVGGTTSLDVKADRRLKSVSIYPQQAFSDIVRVPMPNKAEVTSSTWLSISITYHQTYAPLPGKQILFVPDF